MTLEVYVAIKMMNVAGGYLIPRKEMFGGLPAPEKAIHFPPLQQQQQHQLQQQQQQQLSASSRPFMLGDKVPLLPTCQPQLTSFCVDQQTAPFRHDPYRSEPPMVPHHQSCGYSLPALFSTPSPARGPSGECRVQDDSVYEV